MQPKSVKRIVLATALFVILALVFVFWLAVRPHRETPAIEVPGPSYTDGGEHLTQAQLNDPQDLLSFGVTSENAAGILASLKRADTYSMSLVTAVSSGDQIAQTSAVISRTEEMTRISLRGDGSDAEYLIEGGVLYCWTPGSVEYQSYSLGSTDPAMLAGFPSGTELTQLEKNQILSAELELIDELWTVRVRFRRSDGAVETCWVSIDSGLVIRDVVEENGAVILSTEVRGLTFDAPDASVFLLPDMTVPN